MAGIVLAKCWTFDDGRVCLLSKIGPQAWELRVMSGTRLLRVATFDDLNVAISTATDWRAEFVARAEEIA